MAEPPSRLLDAYRSATGVASPLAAPLLAWRTRKGKEDPVRREERYGKPGLPRPPGALVWIHAASVGETMSILPVAERIIASGSMACLLTTGTVTSARMVASQATSGLVHQYAPLDVAKFVRRFLEYWQPGLAIFTESELWPNMILETDAMDVPLALINARMSPRSHARWQRSAAPMIRQLLGRFSLCLAQSQGDCERLTSLGATAVTCPGNLKFDAPPPAADEDSLTALASAMADRPVWAAVSIHPGEDAAVREAHMALAREDPGILTILAPRHPERGAEISALLQGAGLNTARRTVEGVPNRDTGVFILDTIGDLGLVFRLAPVAFMGGSLVAHGGQNPIEPVKLGAAVLHGPHVANFAEIYAALDRDGSAEQVADPAGLAGSVDALLKDPDACRRRCAIAAATLDGWSGALDRTLAALAPLLHRAAADRKAV